MSDDIPKFVEFLCKNCTHPIDLHKPHCSFSTDDKDSNACECTDPQYYNTIVSDKHIGWIEVHCNSCGALIGFINSTVENIYDFTTLCSNCITKVDHPD